MIEEADSLLRLYSYIGHSGFHATGIPIWDVATLEKLRHGLCTHKCWHNALLFSSLGIAAATDIVPAWANRGSSHSWSVLIEEGDIHPFNPFGNRTCGSISVFTAIWIIINTGDASVCLRFSGRHTDIIWKGRWQMECLLRIYLKLSEV